MQICLLRFISVAILFTLKRTVCIFDSHVGSLLLGEDAELGSKVVEVQSGYLFV